MFWFVNILNVLHIWLDNVNINYVYMDNFIIVINNKLFDKRLQYCRRLRNVDNIFWCLSNIGNLFRRLVSINKIADI